MEFKDKLRALRKEKGLSQQALADAIYVSRSAVAKWENGLGLPGAESMQALLDYFGVQREYFTTEQPEAVIVEKNRRYRKLFIGFAVCVLALLVMIVVFAVSVPLVNDHCAALVTERLLNTPLPSDTEVGASLSCAAKLTGNGNGMQYLGAVLLKSELTQAELEAHYAQYRISEWDCRICAYGDGTLPFAEHKALTFDAELEPAADYYVVYSWGSGIPLFSQLDLRGH